MNWWRKTVADAVAVGRLLATEPALPAPWPAHWLRPEASPAVVRFIETHFDPERTFAEIRLLFRGVTNIEANPMPLRSIFVTLARTSQVAA